MELSAEYLTFEPEADIVAVIVSPFANGTCMELTQLYSISPEEWCTVLVIVSARSAVGLSAIYIFCVFNVRLSKCPVEQSWLPIRVNCTARPGV